MSEDPYKKGAMKMLGLPEHEVTHEQRQLFKETFFECYRDRVYKLGAHVPLVVAEDALISARNLMQHRLEREWPVGTVVLVNLMPRHATLTTAKVLAHSGADVKIEVCKPSKKGKNHCCYVRWQLLTKWPLSTNDL